MDTTRMKLSCSTMVCAAILLFTQIAVASDWRLIGATTSKGVKENQFFDNASIRRGEGGTIVVWMESIPEQQLTQYINKHDRDKELIKRVASKMVTGYVPDILLLPDAKKAYPTDADYQNAITDAIMTEEVANAGEVQKSAMILWEIDCAQKRARDLEIQLFDKSGELKGYTKNKLGEWEYIPPDSNGQRLSDILCQTKP